MDLHSQREHTATPHFSQRSLRGQQNTSRMPLLQLRRGVFYTLHPTPYTLIAFANARRVCTCARWRRYSSEA